MTRLDEQSRLLHERLADKKPGGYVKERQQQLSQAIQRHLRITAKFGA
jgi:predicted component of type VI protein secretion system